MEYTVYVVAYKVPHVEDNQLYLGHAAGNESALGSYWTPMTNQVYKFSSVESANGVLESKTVQRWLKEHQAEGVRVLPLKGTIEIF